MRQRLEALFRDVFRVRPRERVEEWAATHIRLSTEESGDFPGPYDAALNPLPTIVYDAYRSGDWDECIVKKSSQSGVTLAVLILLTWFVAHVRRNFMYVLDSRDEMRRVSKGRLRPMLETCGVSFLREAEDALSNLTLYLRGCIGYLGGAKSVGALAGKSVAFAVCDEVDTYVQDGEAKESAAHNLARDRLKKQSRAFLILLSKPANYQDTITQEYLTGSRHKCFVPCPHCTESKGQLSGFQELEWERGKDEAGNVDYGLKFAHCKDMFGAYDFEQVMRDTYYECKFCRGRIVERHKPWMVANRSWRKTNYGQDKHKPVPRKFSCEITDLYSTFPTASWAILAKEWIEAQGDIDKIKRFKQGRLAQGWVDKKQDADRAGVEKCVAQFDQGHCPVMPDALLQCSDRQADVFKWVKAGFKRGRYVDTCWLVDHGECGTWGDFVRAADTPVHIDHWGDTPDEQRTEPVVLTGLVDEGFRTYQIRQHCISTAFELNEREVLRFYPVKGRGGVQVKDILWQVEDTCQNGAPVTVFHISDDDFKSMLYEESIASRDAIRRCQGDREKALAPLLFIYKDPDPALIEELCQEYRVPKIVRNKPTLVWAEPKGAQDFGDALKYCYAAWYQIRNLIPEPDE